jgi:hypothetical protein
MIALTKEPAVVIYLPPAATVKQLVDVLRWPADYDRVEEAPFVDTDAAGIAVRVRCAPEYVSDLLDAVRAVNGGFLR